VHNKFSVDKNHVANWNQRRVVANDLEPSTLQFQTKQAAL